MIDNNTNTQKSSKKFFLDDALSSLPKKVHDEVVARILPKLTDNRYQTIYNYRNIRLEDKRDMPAVTYLILCKYFNIDPFDGINIDLPAETIADLNIESEEDLAKKFGLAVK